MLPCAKLLQLHYPWDETYFPPHLRPLRDLMPDISTSPSKEEVILMNRLVTTILLDLQRVLEWVQLKYTEVPTILL